MLTPARLGPQERAQAWRELAEREYDVVVIGGGVTGSGVALDATSAPAPPHAARSCSTGDCATWSS